LNRLLAGSGATWVCYCVTWLGNGLVLAALILPVMRWRDPAQFRVHVWPMILAIAASGLFVNGAKLVFARERPPVWAALQAIPIHVPFGMPTDPSFPSGHAQTAFGAAVYLSLLYRKWAPGFLAIAALVAISRIGLGVHFPADVIVGAGCGSLGSWVGYRIVNARSKRRHQS